MSTLPNGHSVTDAVLPDLKTKGRGLPSGPNLAQRDHKPTAENAARGKALINSLMQDKLFLALYRSNDPGVRAAAIEKLNKAHYQAYGDGPTRDVPVAK